MSFRDKNYWAVILGGSSGFGLAAAKKLASEGMHICVAHRDRKGSMARIEEEFASMRAQGVEVVSLNTNALTPEGRQATLDALAEKAGSAGKVRLLMHSIALGNLKLLAPEVEGGGPQAARRLLAEKLGTDPEKLNTVINELFNEGVAEMHALADSASYDSEMLLDEEDMAQTIHAMGTSLLSWVQDVFQRGLFAGDARVLSMTSEGNEVAWRSYGAVSAAKTSLEAVSRGIALEFAPYGIRSNVLQAGVTDTPALRMIPGNDHLRARMKLRNPFKRLTTPEDVGGVVALLCRDESAWINGEIIRVDGGEHIAG